MDYSDFLEAYRQAGKAGDVFYVAAGVSVNALAGALGGVLVQPADRPGALAVYETPSAWVLVRRVEGNRAAVIWKGSGPGRIIEH